MILININVILGINYVYVIFFSFGALVLFLWMEIKLIFK